MLWTEQVRPGGTLGTPTSTCRVTVAVRQHPLPEGGRDNFSRRRRMTKVMRWRGLSVLAGLLVLPMVLAGQAVTRADVVGTWVNTRWQDLWLTPPDSQYVVETI